MEDVAIQLSNYHGREVEKLEAIRYRGMQEGTEHTTAGCGPKA